MRFPFFVSMATTFTPPKSAQSNARRVLDWKKEHGDEVRGMTPVGWARARQLASGSPVSLETVKRMAQFARHLKNATVDPKYKDEPWKDRGYIAWLGWGGTTGIEWAKAISERETTKSLSDIPNYRRVGDASLQKCATCKFFNAQSYCTRYNAKVNAQYTCDTWRPQAAEQKAAGSTPTGAMGHGPGGLFSMPGLSLDQERRLKALRGQGQKPGKQQAERPRRRQARRGQQSSQKAMCPVCGREVADTPVTLATGRKVTTCKSCANRLGVAMKPGMPGGPHGPSIKNPRVYEALRKRGYSKERAAAISNSMKMKSLVTGSTDWRRNGSFAVFKDKAGDYRWVAISSNAYRDRDGEIVSQKALEADVERADKTGEYGPIRFWHMPTVNLGKCDFNMMHNRHLIESGTFTSKEIGQAIAKAAPNLQLSIGFRHPKDEPDRDGVFHNIRRFERSLVPAGRAANPFTSLSVKESNMSTEAEKLKALKALLNDDALMNSVLGQAETNEKQADGMGIAFKSNDDLSKMTPDQLLDYALNLKEAEVEAAEKKAEAPKADKKEDMEEEDDEPMKELKGYVTKMGGYMDRMEKMFGETKKEVSQQGEQVEAHTMRFETLETTIKELTGKLKAATKELATLKSEQPKAIANGYRPTQSADTETTEKAKVEALKEGGDAWGSFLDFAGMSLKQDGVQPG